ncbi:hypothetical protein [Dendronalium sp. ChiSLP03b]
MGCKYLPPKNSAQGWDLSPPHTVLKSAALQDGVGLLAGIAQK